MKSLLALGLSLLSVSASPIVGVPWTPSKDLAPRVQERQAACTNGPTTRNCWTSGFDIDTNPYQSWPSGNTVSYDLTITNTTCNPDGHGSRVCMLINDNFYGPTIRANWGDTISVTVRNNLQHNGTSIHWHGLRQLNTNIQDGVNGVTECALAPGDSKTYTFQATEYGTSWYHSHFSVQYGDGVVGPIIIDGPATANYDIDLGSYLVQDWYYLTAFQAGALAAAGGGAPPTGDTILVNGTNQNAAGGGAYDNVTLTPNQSHRLRIVNTGVDSQLRVTLDNHPFTVIAHDFVPVVPYVTNYLQVGIGQRYDVIINANQTAGSYWFRADPETQCQSANNNPGRAIFTYDGQSVTTPASTAAANPPTGCNNSPAAPHIALDVPSAPFQQQAQTLPVTFGPVTTNNQSLVLWTVNGSSMRIDPGFPTLEYIAESNFSFPAEYNVINISASASWAYWIIQQAAGAPPIAHPIHLHGHDFYVLGTGTGTFSSSSISSLTFTNPPRRDVAFLPGGSWLVIAYPTDNPGAWLMHCHIAFHVSLGLSVQFLEKQSQITLPAQNSEWYNTCNNWNSYQNSQPLYPQDDSGLRKRWPPADDMSPAEWASRSVTF